MPPVPTLLVTGGAGFIGSNFVLSTVQRGEYAVVNLDALTYAGNLDNLASIAGCAGHRFVHGNIADRPLVTRLLAEHRPAAIVNFAAESHVDRSIDEPAAFVETNVLGTFELLEATRAYVASQPIGEALLRFVHISTDEVFGSLGTEGFFTERSQYAPNSPYAASKASADHFARAYRETYGVPVVTMNCSNNYGPYQFPEKLIPLVILNALEGKPLPVYGDGKNIRDWLYVEDHCDAIRAVLASGRIGETYNIGGRNERSNVEIVETICDLLDELAPRGASNGTPQRSYRELITFVKDRPGHDRRYALDPTKAETELGWRASHALRDGLKKTVRWYIDHTEWCARIASGSYRRERLGLRIGAST